MFVLHFWPAIKIAPAVGAILGVVWAVTMVRIRGLSLRCTLEEYRAIAGVRSLQEISTFCSNTALKAALVVSIIELPIVPFGKTAALLMLPAGWVFIIAWTVYRAWKINDQASLNGGLDVFQISGGVALLMMFGVFLHVALGATQAGMLDANFSDLDRIKGLFISNACAAPVAIVVAVFGLNIFYRSFARPTK